MAIIETFLLNQLHKAISKAKLSNNCLSKLYQLHEECHKVKVIIQDKKPGTGASVDLIRKEKLYYLNNVMTEWLMLLEKHHHPTSETIRLVNDLRGRLKQIKKDLQDGPAKKDDSVQGGMQESSPKDLEVYQWSSRSVNLIKIHGIEDKELIMERLLLKEGFKAIGIVGMAGVGKTALCQVAFNNQQVKNHFLPRIWVCLSKQPKVHTDYKEELVKRILKCLGFDNEVIDKVGRQGGICRLLFALRLQLNRQRYLIVLDDVWNKEEDFKNFCSSLTGDEKKKDRLEYGLPKGRGGTVIITSRCEIMAESMVGGKNWHSLLPLADDESCWNIFRDAVDEKDEIALTQDMELKLKHEIVKKCAGLPLIAKMLGQIEHDKKKNHQGQTQKEAHQQDA